MSEFLPRAVREELETARKTGRRKRRHMKVRAGGQDFTILRYWDDGFSVAADDAPGLRGLVDLFDRGRHLCQALIVTSSEADGERVFEIKSATPADPAPPPADFVRDRAEPVALLPDLDT